MAYLRKECQSEMFWEDCTKFSFGTYALYRAGERCSNVFACRCSARSTPMRALELIDTVRAI